MKTLVASTASLVMILGTTAGTARANHQIDADALTHALKRQAREIYIEVATHFRSAAQYRRMVRTAYDLYELADHIEGVADDGQSAFHVRNDLHELHDLLDCLEDQTLELRVSRISAGGGFRGMAVGPEHVQHLSLLVAAADDTLHQLENLLARGQVRNYPTNRNYGLGGGPNFGTQPMPPVSRQTVPGGVRIPLQFGKQGGVSFNLVLR